MSETPDDLQNAQEPDFVREVVDRRSGGDRRQTPRELSNYTGPERRVASRRTGLERRRGAGIRREEDRRSAEEGEMTPEQFEFVKAMESYKRKKNKPFPNWVDVLEVITALGYQSVEAKTIDLKDAPKSIQDSSELTAAQSEFVRAVETYKHVNKKRFPTWTEVLEVVDQLGYRKMNVRAMDLPNVPEAPIYKKAA